MTYVTDTPRAIAGFVGGASAGGLIVALFFLRVATAERGFEYLDKSDLQSLFGIFLSASVFWGIGLAFFGLPVWVLLHKWQLRQWPIFLLAGIGVCFLAMLALQVLGTPDTGFSTRNSDGLAIVYGNRTLRGWIEALAVSGVFGAAGGIVALVAWRIAYRRQPTHV